MALPVHVPVRLRKIGPGPGLCIEINPLPAGLNGALHYPVLILPVEFGHYRPTESGRRGIPAPCEEFRSRVRNSGAVWGFQRRVSADLLVFSTAAVRWSVLAERSFDV